MSQIDPVLRFGPMLAGIDKPARYLGGESGTIRKPEADYKVMLCFPDMYEIGMSNNAMRIIYAAINKLEGIACERVFTPASDFETLLRNHGVPLYGLENGTPVIDSDLLGFTVGYELAATNILSVLELSGIPLLSQERGENHPIVIAGGPAMTNPAPYTKILDAVWIGEAEEAFFDLLTELARMKSQGKDRKDCLARITSEPAFWMPGKKATRHVFAGFATREYGHHFPVPIVKPVQDHGVVEIMRGCPNGCRFCHAGYFYRPMRVRNPDLIFAEVESQVRIAGHRAITLSSLSSGDYPGIFSLIEGLNRLWSKERVSFQLPSLKIESFPLELLEQLSGTRKGGLTFAIETPLEQWQLVLNKQVSLDRILKILDEAAKAGYRLAKFYFMIGLPVPAQEISEEQAIIDFLQELTKHTGIKLNVTLATFVPKPHTPFQWAEQIKPDEAIQKIYRIKDAFKNNSKVKISYHAPFLSWLEGMIARGDERVGDIIIEAYRLGARFDAWDDKFRKDLWQDIVHRNDDLIQTLLGIKARGESLPWDGVSVGISKGYFAKEFDRSRRAMTTSACMEKCTGPCGACTDSIQVTPQQTTNAKALSSTFIQKPVVHTEKGEAILLPVEDKGQGSSRPTNERIRLFFKYSKNGAAAFYAHHGVWEMLAMAITRAGIPMLQSEGFNPAPRLEISEPLPLGFSSDDEYGTFLASSLPVDPQVVPELVNSFLPEGIRVHSLDLVRSFEGQRFPSLSSVHWGSSFLLTFVSEINTTALTEIFKTLQQVIASKIELSSASVSLAQGSRTIQVLLPFTGKRDLGLSALYEAATGTSIRDTQVQVRRLAQYAKANNGDPITYSHFYGTPIKNANIE